MNRDDPEKRIAGLERQLADSKAAAGRDRAGEQPPPQFSDTQPIAWQGAIADKHARRRAQYARAGAHFRAMAAQQRRAKSTENLIGWIIVGLSGVIGCVIVVPVVVTLVFPFR